MSSPDYKRYFWDRWIFRCVYKYISLFKAVDYLYDKKIPNFTQSGGDGSVILLLLGPRTTWIATCFPMVRLAIESRLPGIIAGEHWSAYHSWTGLEDCPARWSPPHCLFFDWPNFHLLTAKEQPAIWELAQRHPIPDFQFINPTPNCNLGNFLNWYFFKQIDCIFTYSLIFK